MEKLGITESNSLSRLGEAQSQIPMFLRAPLRSLLKFLGLRCIIITSGAICTAVSAFGQCPTPSPGTSENAYVTTVHSDGSRTRYALPPSPTDTDRGCVLSFAKDHAVSGDTIIVGPGQASANNLLKNGVNWSFMTGASVVGSTSSTAAIFDDYIYGANGPVTSVISGDGEFSGGAVIYLHNNSNITFTARSLTSTQNVVITRLATLYLHAQQIVGIGSSSSAVWWRSGDCFVEADKIIAPTSVVVYSDALADKQGSYFWVNAKQIENSFACPSGSPCPSPSPTPTTNQKGVWFKGDDADARTWVNALQIKAPVAVYSSASGGVNYVKAEKIFGQLKHTAGSLYVDAQKISDDGLNSNLIYLSGEQSWLNILQIDDAGLTGSPTAVTVLSGTHYLRGSSLIRGTSGEGIALSDGSLTVNGLTITTQSGSNDLVSTGGTLTVLGCQYSLSKTSGTIYEGDPRVMVAPGYGVGTTNPADGSTYQLFLNTSDHHVYAWNGTSWVRLDN